MANSRQQRLFPKFGPGFLDAYASEFITDPKIAIIELIANAWDAGADEVRIEWPGKLGQQMSITDNGEGMTYDEFKQRWLTISYRRPLGQGTEVVFPKDNRQSKRPVFGKNGKGRYSVFCFFDKFRLESQRNGKLSLFQVERRDNDVPFNVVSWGQHDWKGHGISFTGILKHHYVSTDELISMIKSRFTIDANFDVLINGRSLDPNQLENQVRNEYTNIARTSERPRESRKEYLPEYQQFSHLQTSLIFFSEAARKYSLSKSTLESWVHEWDDVLIKSKYEGHRLLLREADVAYCAFVYHQKMADEKRRRGHTFNRDGTPFKPLSQNMLER